MKKFLIMILTLFILTGCTDSANNDSKYFKVLDLNYNGPSLDDKWFDVENFYTIENNVKIGSGQAFEVTLKYNVDGDTAHFNLPNSSYSSVFTSSFRFLNMDTEETYGDVEEWGKPASTYTAYLLDNAYSIALQTDPGDEVADAYGRGLVWVWVQMDKNSEYELLNYKLVQQGLAKVAYLYGAGESIYYDNVSYTNWMYKAESEAKSNLRGMYSNLLDPYWDYDNNNFLPQYQ